MRRWIVWLAALLLVVMSAAAYIAAYRKLEEPAITCERIRGLPKVAEALSPERDYVITSRGCDPGEYFLVELPADNAPHSRNLSASLGLSERGQRLVLLVHGYRTLERQAANQYRLVARVFRERKFPGVLLAYDWPSVAGFWDQSASTRSLFLGQVKNTGIGTPDYQEISGYTVDSLKAANVGGPSLAKIISDLGTSRPEAHIDVICFSMGCYVLQKALERSGGTIPRNIDHLVFLAADIDRDALPGIVKPSRPDQRVTVHFSREDSVLSVASRVMNAGKPRLGAIGPPLPVPKHVSVSDETAALGEDSLGSTTPVHSRYLDASYPVVTRVVDFLTGSIKP